METLMRCGVGCLRGRFTVGFSPEVSSLSSRDRSTCAAQRRMVAQTPCHTCLHPIEFPTHSEKYTDQHMQIIRISITFLSLWFYVAVASPGMAQSSVPENEVIVRIAHIGPVSNRAIGDLGVEGENAAVLAIEDLNLRSIHIGGKKAIFKVENFDDGANPDMAIAVAKRACQSGFVGVIGHLNSGTSIKAAPIYNQCGLPHITVAATNPRLTEMGYETTFRVIGNDAVLGHVMAKVAMNELNVKRIAIVSDRTAYGEIITTNFLEMATSLGADVVLKDSLMEASPNLTAVGEHLKSANAELVIFGGFDGLAGKLLKEMAFQNLNTMKFMGGDGICSDSLPKLAGNVEPVSHVICGEAGAKIDNMLGAANFGARYVSRYGKPIKGYATQTYDAIFALALAMQSADSIDPKTYLPFLRRVSFDGVSGKIEFDAKGDLIAPTFSLYVYRDGKKLARK